jgi:AraC family transcriptional activator of pobA
MNITSENPEARLLRDLATMIGDEYKNHRPLAFYCDSLGVSISMLNKLTGVHFGKSMRELLTERLLMSAQYYLKETSLSVKWITYELGFQDPAYFSKWFKRISGEPPKSYRRLNFRIRLASQARD